jgi:hypothetical protein
MPFLWLELEPAGWFPVIRRARLLYQIIVWFANLISEGLPVCRECFVRSRSELFDPLTMGRRRGAYPQNSSAGASAEAQDMFCRNSTGHTFPSLCTLRLRPAKVCGASLAGSHMVSINKELQAAKAAKVAINALSMATPKSAVLATLVKAKHAAVFNLSSGGALNEARSKVGIALSIIMHGMPTQKKIDKAKSAIDVWIRELEGSL